MNIWAGCHKCNSEQGGNIPGYDEQLIKLYGREQWEAIKFALKHDHQLLKLTPQEIQEKAAEARKIVREMEKAAKMYSLEERITKRIEINQRLGIYE